MTVVMIGPPAAGKTAVGEQLAARLRLPFTDTDAVVAAGNGPIRDLFAEHGESHFRRLERAAVAEAVREAGVVALGGGAVLSADTRADLAEVLVVLLTASPEAAAKRIGTGERPLVTDLESWKRLVAERGELYRSLADYTADTSHRPVGAIAEEIARWVESPLGGKRVR